MDLPPNALIFEDNVKREIENPLSPLSFDQIERYADAFAGKIWQSPTTQQTELFRKAGRVAKDGWNDALHQDEERHIFEQESKKDFWKQTKTLQVTIVTLCFSAIIQGWLQTGLNGANQVWPEQFGLQLRDGSLLVWADSKSRWIFAGVNAITYLAASLLGCWLADPLQAHYFGRRGAIFIAGVVILASVVGASCTRNWQQLMICRALVGLGMGAKASVTPIFGAEVSPNHLRGKLVMNWQFFDAVGIFLGFTANLVVSKIGPLSWRFQMASAVFPTLCLLTLALTIPESPRWLLKKGKINQAYEAMCLLRNNPLQAATELLYANAQIQAEVALLPRRNEDAERRGGPNDVTGFQKSVKSLGYWTRLRQLFNDSRTRRAVVASSIVMLSQQLCGVNIIAFYSSTFFRDANDSNDDGMKALFLSWGIGAANFLFCIPAYLLIDTRGRRFLLLATYPGMIVSLFAASLSFLADDRTLRIGLVGFFIFLFILFYSSGQGPVPFAYSSEVFPLFNREVGMSFAVFVNFFGAGLLTLLVPLAQSTVGIDPTTQREYNLEQSRLLGLFTGLSVLAFLLIFHFVPETKLAVEYVVEDQKALKYISLEELSYIFGVRTFHHVSYQWREWVPWAFRYTKWKLGSLAHSNAEKPTLKPLCDWVDHRRELQEVRGNSTGVQTREILVERCQNCNHVETRRNPPGGLHGDAPTEM